MSEQLLPTPYRELEPLVERWALDNQDARQVARREASPAELQAFYDAMVGKVEEIITYLNEFPLDSMEPLEARLLYLTLSLAEVAPHVELYRCDPRVPYSFEEERFIADHGALPHFLGQLYSAS